VDIGVDIAQRGSVVCREVWHSSINGVVMPPKPQMIAKQDWRYVSGGGRVMRNAHEPSTEITSLAFASNGHSLASRGADETLKVFLTVCVSFCFYLSV